MPLAEMIQEETEAERRYFSHPFTLMIRALAVEFPGAVITIGGMPRKGERYRLRTHIFEVVTERPLTMVGPAGIRRKVDTETFGRMERVP